MVKVGWAEKTKTLHVIAFSLALLMSNVKPARSELSACVMIKRNIQLIKRYFDLFIVLPAISILFMLR